MLVRKIIIVLKLLKQLMILPKTVLRKFIVPNVHVIIIAARLSFQKVVVRNSFLLLQKLIAGITLLIIPS